MLVKLKLPIWEGTYKSANQGEIKDFNLFFNEKINLIQQKYVSKIFYEDKDYSFITLPPGSSAYANKIGDSYIRRISKFIKGREIHNVLEIGAGSDYIAKGIYKNNKYNSATLIDPALRINFSRKIQTIKSYYPSAKIEHQKYDFIYSINTLEHVLNPKKFLMQVRKNITKDGLALFIFPSIEEQFRRGDIGALLHEHINYFDYKSSRFLFQKCGFNILEFSSKNDEITILTSKESLPLRNQIVYCDNEIEEISTTFAKMLAKIKLNKEKILNYHSKGLKIGFHGACNALSNFLYLSELYKIKDFYIFDSDSTKTNTYLPLSCNKILNSRSNLYKDMDVLFISASTFGREIFNYAKDFINPINIINLFE